MRVMICLSHVCQRRVTGGISIIWKGCSCMSLQRNLSAATLPLFPSRSQTTWILGTQNSIHSPSLVCIAAAVRKPPLFLLPSLYTAYCASRGWNLDAVVFARHASASVLSPHRSSRCQPLMKTISEKVAGFCLYLAAVAA